MEKHGLVTWGETSEESYLKTIAIINEAASFIEARVNEANLYGGSKYETLSADARKELLAQVLPVVRGAVSNEKK